MAQRPFPASFAPDNPARERGGDFYEKNVPRIPLASVTYFITFRCYGTHLPGDARGSFDHVRNGERRYTRPTPRWNDTIGPTCGNPSSHS